MNNYKVKNATGYAASLPYIVARKSEGELWFCDGFADYKQAEDVAFSIGGYVLGNNLYYSPSVKNRHISLFQLFTETDDYCVAKHYVLRAIPYVEKIAALPLDDNHLYIFLVAALAALYYAIDSGKNVGSAFEEYQGHLRLACNKSLIKEN